MHRFPLWFTLVTVLGGTLTLSPGCARQARVTGLKTAVERVETDGRLTALNFRSSFQAEGLANQQLICLVQLFDRNRRPVPSSDGRYESKAGTVSATKTVFAFSDFETFRDVLVSIPALELGLTQDHLPARGYVGVFDIGGKCLAVTSCPLPVRSIEELLPPMAGPSEPPPAAPETATAAQVPGPAEEQTGDARTPSEEGAPSEVTAPPPSPAAPAPPAPVAAPVAARETSPPQSLPPDATSYWFVRPPRAHRFPVLAGPFLSAETARQSAGESGIVMEIPVEEQVWFIPIWNPQESSRMGWVGPCLTAEEAAQAARLLVECVLPGSHLQTADPVRLSLEEGLKRRVDLGDVAHLCDSARKK